MPAGIIAVLCTEMTSGGPQLELRSKMNATYRTSMTWHSFICSAWQGIKSMTIHPIADLHSTVRYRNSEAANFSLVSHSQEALRVAIDSTTFMPWVNNTTAMPILFAPSLLHHEGMYCSLKIYPPLQSSCK